MRRRGISPVMRFAIGTLASATLLLLSGAVGVVGSWALAAGAVSLLVGAIIGAVAMEERDLRSEDRLLEAM